MNLTYRIYENVDLPPDAVIEDFVILGVPPRGHKEGEMKTVIGPGAQIRSHTVIYAGNRIGKGFQTGNKVNIRELNEIGDNVSIGTLSVVEHHVKIGNNVRIHTQVFVPEYSVLEDDSWLGPNVVLTNAKYPVSPGVKNSLKGPIIKKGAKIGANSTILPGVVIGINALVGAGSVVVKDVPDGGVVVGNPARIIKNIKELPY
jgi:acetyltransferase-like isoleucine patch superfamily enzyme